MLNSPISITAGLSVGVFLLVIVWVAARGNEIAVPISAAQTQTSAPEGTSMPQTTAVASATSSDLSDFAPQVVGLLASQYAQMQKNGTYTPEAAAAVAQQIAPSIKAPIVYKTFSIADIQTTPDTSYARMQQYQKDLRAALAPLAKNTTPEISIFSAYTQTGDTKYLDQLRTVAQEYQASVSAAATLQVPQDALAYHIGILNAMGEFGGALSALAQNASDPITTMGLLNTYNDAEADMVSSFNGFASYVQHHSKS
jgi:hypothetical protein